jgi:hypothetical protein
MRVVLGIAFAIWLVSFACLAASMFRCVSVVGFLTAKDGAALQCFNMTRCARCARTPQRGRGDDIAAAGI